MRPVRVLLLTMSRVPPTFVAGRAVAARERS